MKTNSDHIFHLPTWWFILPSYLTLWSIGFSLYNFFDGNGMMQAFGIDTGGASDFIMLNSAGRYVALAIGMILGIWIFRTFSSLLLTLLVRLSMDVLDLIAGLQTGVIIDSMGVVQSFLMFLIPNLVSIYFLIKFRNKRDVLASD